MFNALKKKFSSWFGKNEEAKEKKKPSKKSKESVKKEKVKEVKQEKKKRSLQVIKEERQVTEKVIEDIKIEKPGEIKSIPQIESLEKEQEIKEEKPKEGGFFSKLISKFSGTKLTQEHFDEIFMELELTLLENNVALTVVDKIRANLSKALIGIEIKKSEIDKKILQSLKDSILEVLIEPPDIIKNIRNKKEPFVILFFGINGTGKTTSIAKLAHLLKKHDISCVLAAADTFRAASIEQLKTHAESLSVPIVSHDYGSDPASVAFDAISYAKTHKIKCVLIDTAGRMYTKSNLLKEMEKIIRVSKPDLKIFVGESITGNDATEQAKTFNETAGIDGMILSKADIDEKAGTILSVSFVTGKPIYFLGTGQSYKELQDFKKSEVLKHLGL